MTKETKEPLLNYWYRALSAPFGIEIICADPDSTRSQLYSVRKEAKDTDLNQISICQSPFDPIRLWLVKKEHKP